MMRYDTRVCVETVGGEGGDGKGSVVHLQVLKRRERRETRWHLVEVGLCPGG